MTFLRSTLASLVAAPLLCLGLATPASAGTCPAIGKTWYSNYNCNTAAGGSHQACDKFVVTGRDPTHGIYAVAHYKNGYYQWYKVSQTIRYC
ncbi:hypothetical protein [Luteimonas aquatica]|uniref:hypothetical protein n=1 Tax=Luteimonas aquatica TaxID=450364 RepID=UPI001F58AAA3|nr:hypothetical protein [Luteimonas aquatica]